MTPVLVSPVNDNALMPKSSNPGICKRHAQRMVHEINSIMFFKGCYLGKINGRPLIRIAPGRTVNAVQVGCQVGIDSDAHNGHLATTAHDLRNNVAFTLTLCRKRNFFVKSAFQRWDQPGMMGRRSKDRNGLSTSGTDCPVGPVSVADQGWP